LKTTALSDVEIIRRQEAENERLLTR